MTRAGLGASRGESGRDALEKEHLELLLRASEILGSSLEVPAIVDSLMDQVIEVIGAERGFVLIRDEETGARRIQSARSMEPDTLDKEGFRISRGVVERVEREGVSILTSDALQDPRLRDQRSVSLYDLKSILCVPLCLQGRVLGVIYADHTMERGVFTPREKALLESIARMAAVALENAMLYEKLQRVHADSMERARRELAATHAQLVQSSKMAAVGQLAAGVAHEINTPLSAVQLNVSTVMEHVTDARDRRRLDIAAQAVSRCKSIIDTLLRFSRVSGGSLERVDVARVVRTTLELMDHDLGKTGVDVIEAVGEPVLARGREGEISQVLMNLLMNARDAVRAMPPDHPRRVEVRSRREGDRVIVEVADNGCGMDEGTRDRIFEPFFTTRPVGEGLGLGLSITYEILVRCGGEIAVASTPGQGTTFTVTLAAYPGS